jgi:SAM-dependent methyltransferase
MRSSRLHETRRPCPFCCSESSASFGMTDNVWVKCTVCGSVFQDITADKFQQFHGEAFQDHGFADAVVASCGLEPATALWNQLALPGRSLLEIGPGTGHTLAAAHRAGRTVTAVEASEVHRTFIRETWGIDSVYSDISAIPQGRTYDAVFSINVIEHVYDVASFLRSIANVLAPGGVCFISTANAASLEASLLRTRWPQCKPPDHVSFPSPKGMAAAARSIGLRAERVWSAEQPFEFAISTLVAARDWRRERQGRSGATNQASLDWSPAGSLDAASRRRLARFAMVSSRFDPTSRLLGALGCAGSVKARLRPATQPMVSPKR